MLDVKRFREDFDGVKAALAKRHKDYHLEKFTELDEKRRTLIKEIEELKAKQNSETKQIPVFKKEGKDVAPLMAEMKQLSEKIKALDPELKALDEEIRQFLLSVPNTPNPLVADGVDDSENVEIRRVGEPTKFDFEPKAHWDIGKDLDLFDAEVAAKISGTRFTVYKGLGARLERAITQFMLDTHVEKHGYTEIFRSLKLPVLETVIPSAERYKKDSGMKGPLFRSTLFPPSSSAMKGSSLDLLAAEIETILKLQ